MITENDLVLYNGVYVRRSDPAGTTDRKMVKECQKNYGLFSYTKDSVVLDLGANIGAFAHMVPAWVSSYVAFEPDVDNYAVLQHNVLSKFETVDAAVSCMRDPTITFFVRGSKNAACSGTATPLNKANTTEVVVKNECAQDVFMDMQPTHLKMDIEGGERGIFRNWSDGTWKFPASFKEMAIEVHTMGFAKEFEEQHHPFLEQLGFELISTSPITGFKNKTAEPKFVFGHEIRGTMFGIDMFYRMKA